MGVEDRVGKIETDIEWIKHSMAQSALILGKVAEDMHRMTEIQIQQIEDRRAMDRVFQQQDALDKRLDKINSTVSRLSNSLVAQQNEERGKVLHQATVTILTVVTTLISAYIAKKFGFA